MKKISLFLILLAPVAIHAAEQSNNTTRVYTIPGQNGLGFNTRMAKEVLGDYIDVVEVPTPGVRGTPGSPDLGQDVCIKLLEDTFNANPPRHGQKVIIAASSQGTATAFTALAQQKIRADGLILEAALVSGNSAIMHTVDAMYGLKKITQLPGAYYWLPYLAKALFPRYSPAGTQPIKLADKLPKIPVAFAHHMNDPQLSYDDARILEYALRTSGNDKTFFMYQNSLDRAHVCILSRGHRESVWQFFAGQSQYYQLPDHDKQAQYEQFMAREKNHERIAPFIKVGTAVAVAYAAFRIAKRLAPLARKIGIG